jgi:hypothetical protein
MQLHALNTSAHVQIDAKYTAGELETLIADLAELRGRMTPGVPLTPPTSESTAGDMQRVSVQNDPYLAIKRLKSGDGRLWARSQGHGWIAFNLPRAKLAVLRDHLIAITPDIEPTRQLLSEDVPQGNRSN